MSNLTISIFENQIFLEIVKEIQSLSKFKFTNFTNIELCVSDAKKNNKLVVFFKNERNDEMYKHIIKQNIPILVISNLKNFKKENLNEYTDLLNMPFKILDFEKKIISIIAKFQFKKNSLIHLNNYVIDKNERKIKKDNIELQLSEKEVNFLILFSTSKEPINKKVVLTKVWNYSSDTETHTVETHIHRLRKKILEKFNDKNFIKNNSKGYFI